MKKINKEREEELDRILDEEGDKWDTKELGNKQSTTEQSFEYRKKKASIVTTIRMTPSMVKDLKKIADKKGIPYQTLIKSILNDFIQQDEKSA